MNMQGANITFQQNADQFAASSGVSAAGVASSLASMNGLSPYVWTEPKTGLLASVVPSDATWHPLFDHDYVEIANHMVDVLGSPNFDQQTKSTLLGRIKDVTIQSYEVRAMGYFYQLLIAGIVLGILALLLFGFNVMEYPKVIGVWMVILGGIYLYSTYWAKGAGESYWTTFISDFTSKRNAGLTPAKILESYGSDLNREKDRDAMARANANHNQAGGMSPFVGAMAGSLIGNLFGK